MRRNLLFVGAALLALLALLALSAAGCRVSPWIQDPACRAAYDNCAAACPLGPPEPPPMAGPGGATPSLERGCLNGCYLDARACQGRADERAEPPAALPPALPPGLPPALPPGLPQPPAQPPSAPEGP
jgi:hypothetical protein